MKKVFFTLVGCHYFYGKDFLEKGMEVYLEKNPDNPVDREAIKVNLPGLGQIGHVANSPYTVLGESFSAGRLYDKIGHEAKAKIVLICKKGTLCEMNIED